MKSVYSCFTSNRRINLGQECSGNLYKIDPALVAGGEKTSNITNYPTTKSYQQY